MNFHKSMWFVKTFVVLIISEAVHSFRCDRRPYGSTMQATPPDGRFELTVVGIKDSYIPEQLYRVKLSETDGESRFTLFVISAEGDLKPDERNPRRLISQDPGELRPQDPLEAKFSDRCPYSVEQANSGFKEAVEVYWQAPPSNSGCVTLRAMVAENENVWYEDGGPLTARICEDVQQPDDVTPQLNYECSVCDEAKYEVSFTGIWSRNTHPPQFPENDWVPRYSDLVGASHSADFVLWAPGTLATPGMRDLAEHANTTQLEAEIREKIGDGVRTVIKGKGHSYRKMKSTTYSFFRADKVNHLITTAVSIYPSPDWFLGVTRFELCQQDNTWIQKRELNLYPWDAGTDSGVSYESANIATFPQDAVSRVQMSSYDKNSPFYEIDMKDLQPFGKLEIKLIRTYHKECAEGEADGGEGVGKEEDKGEEQPSGPEPEEPSRYHNPDDSGREAPIEQDPEADEECPISQWQEWSACEGRCVRGRVRGYRWRERYHLVDGVPVEKFDPEVKWASKKEVPEACKEAYEVFEREECEDDCSEKKDILASRRLPIIPGNPWNSKKRDSPIGDQI
ncbi:spondin-1-like [Plutella xylostella]|uniref:spondin-1-like n=1 Tax=Plutella xylostella TaxID=51655 RepID=UPI002032588C|nr:spondin-1-like [Plutella xylostella]